MEDWYVLKRCYFNILKDYNLFCKYKYCIDPQTQNNNHIHLIKLTRLLRLARLLQKMDRYFQYSAMILTLLMLFFTLVAHWLACIWYVIADNEKNKHDKRWDLGKHYCNSINQNRNKS